MVNTCSVLVKDKVVCEVKVRNAGEDFLFFASRKHVYLSLCRSSRIWLDIESFETSKLVQ
jgi:hypothetical protein